MPPRKSFQILSVPHMYTLLNRAQFYLTTASGSLFKVSKREVFEGTKPYTRIHVLRLLAEFPTCGKP